MNRNAILGVIVLLLAIYRSVQLCTPGWRRRVRWGRGRNSAPVSAVAHACWLLMLYATTGVLMGPLFGMRLTKELALAIVAGTWGLVILTALVDIVRWKLRTPEPPTAETDEDDEDADDAPSGPPADSPPDAKP